MSLALAALTLTNAGHGISQSLLGWQQAGIAASRNTLVEEALKANADYLLWIDADMAFPPDAAVTLLAHGKDIAGCTYGTRSKPYLLNGRPKNLAEAETASGLREFYHLPSGFMLVKADVYRKVPKPWYFETYAYPGRPHEQIKALLCDVLNLTPRALDDALFWLKEFLVDETITHTRSEDTNFCLKASRNGFEIFGDLDLSRRIVHMGKHAISMGSA